MTTGIINLRAKRRIEAYSFEVDLTEILQGATVDSGTTRVVVVSGYDPNPSELLNGSYSIVDEILSQPIRRGVPGVIYSIIFDFILSDTRNTSVVCRQAIVLDAIPVDGIYTSMYFTSWLYPIEIRESLGILIAPLTGSLVVGLIETITDDGLGVVFAPISGEMREPLVRTYVEEAFAVDITPLDGELLQLLIETETAEAMSVEIEPLEGELITLLVYTETVEGLELMITPIGGALV